MKITIVGGGIGGLSCALSLHAAGFDDVDVYETVSTVKEIGVGVNLLPHAVRELDELGLLDELYQTAIPTEELSYLTQRGQLVWKEPRGIAAGYRWPQFSIHRGHLLGIIHRAALARLDDERIHVGHHFQGFGQASNKRMWAEFKTERGTEKVKSDLIIACDGVHSTARASLYPQEGPPLWNGTTMWRGVTLAEPFWSGKSMFIAGRFVHRVVVYPISRSYYDQGKSLINWVAEKRLDEDQPMPKQDWQHQVDVDEVMANFEEFDFPFLSMPALIRNAEAIFKYPMVDRDPLDTWVHGRLTLLGDAAHPMYPVGSNGASQAIIDARTLVHALATEASIDAALEKYDSIRRPATAAVVLANRQVGPEKCIELAEERAPNGFEKIDDVISQTELEEIALNYKQTAGFDPQVLNHRESLNASV